MSLRYRLFLWVSGLFIVVSLCSYFSENYVAQSQLHKAQAELRKKILAISEKRRVELQSFLASVIAEDEIKINVVLNNISSYSPQALRFGPTSNNLQKGTWGDASDLLLGYQWIDFIQNTNQGKVTAGIIPQKTAMDSFYRFKIDEDLSWIYNANLKKNSAPFLGVRVPYSLVTSSPLVEILVRMPGAVPDIYLLFDIKDLVDLDKKDLESIFLNEGQKTFPPIPIKWTEGYEFDVDPFVKAFQRGRHLLLSQKIKIPGYSSDEIQQKRALAISQPDARVSFVPKQEHLFSIGNGEMMKRFEEISLRYTQVNMIWALSAMFDSQIFGDSLFSFPSPTAAVLFDDDNALGAGIVTKDVLFEQRIYDDSSYYKNNASKDPSSNLATSLSIITLPELKRIFIANTAQLNLSSDQNIQPPDDARTGYLTLGVDANHILQRLVLAVGQAAILVRGKEPLSGYSLLGEKMDIDRDVDLDIVQMQMQKSGIVSWNHQNYFFMNIQPFPDVDLHFFLLNPESKEFALLHDLETGSQQVVDSIRLNIHIAGLVGLLIAILLLHNISRNITQPIIQLAAATGDIVQGSLQQIKLSLPPQKHNDEIAVLCRSFEEMVTGLQEKEKVKAVLNKVVSQEIAQEILKGSIHLGGEEKKVTVLFADIRDFTAITQNMLPQQVIDLLNACMTKISQSIDRNKGVIDKYVGDEAMALFGAPLSRSEDAFNAIKSAIEIVESINEWNRQRFLSGKLPIELGMGIHTGQMLAGNMGSENRLNYTVIGSSVNLASRVCDFAKGMEILITKQTLDEPLVKESIDFEALPPMQFKGFDNRVEVYRVIRIKK
jgi:class 3 adenylate cyclase